jgi:sialidase-1
MQKSERIKEDAMQTPFLDKQSLFAAHTGGYAIYRIPGLVVTARGVVLAYCEARKSVQGDWGTTNLLLRRSLDAGATWETPYQINPPDLIVPKNPLAMQHGLATAEEQLFDNPVAIADTDGSVHLLYCAEYARCFYARSDDDGLTFSPPVDITATFEAFRPDYAWKVIATGPGHGIQLRNGRLLVPVWLSTGTGGHAHRPSCVAVIYSDDHGATWQRGAIVVRDPAPSNPSETNAVQLADGRVLLNIRSESPRHRRLVTYSADGATGWSEAAYDEALFEPICFASLVRVSAPPPRSRNRLLFVNPDSRQSQVGANAWGAWPRENLTLRLSYDEGQTWPVARVLDPGLGGYADLAVGADGMLYCFYEGGGVGGDMFASASLVLARFNLEWLTENRDSLE